VYPTADDEWVVIGGNQDSVFKRMAEAMGHAEWASAEGPFVSHEQRGERQMELDGLIAAWTRALPTSDVLSVMDAAGVPAGRIYTAADIAQDPHYRAREMIISVPDPGLKGEPVPMQGVVPRLSATPATVTRGGPLLGEHNEEIWGALAGADALPALRERGII
jgi:crotonobetainyl-CoA:carnitine CoA-transferase CaiB-like acyl-CoA transferase